MTDDACKQPVPVETIVAACRRAFGEGARVGAVTKISIGTYNSTYRVELDGRDPVILRVAPDPARQSRWERSSMRNEHAAAPYFAALGSLVPRDLFVDFTRQLIGRDYMVQAMLPGVPAAEGLDAYANHVPYYRQLGAITRSIHDVRGVEFGRVAGPRFATWSEALADHFRTVAGAYEDAGLDHGDIGRIVAAIGAHRAVLDEIVEPRLLHGDLWHLNILIDPDAPDPTIVGILDYDGAWWGDPFADWTIHQLGHRAGTEVDAFWEAYGSPPRNAIRQLFYQARNRAGARLDIHRRGIDLAGVPPIHWDLTEVLAQLDG